MLHPELTPAERRRLFRRGIELFNAARFYDCHEAFEEIWRSTTPEPRDLFQGLIQVAVGLYHYFENDNPGPARRVLDRGVARLRPLVPRCRGLDLEGLLAQAGEWRIFLARAESEEGEQDGEPPELPRIVVVDGEAVG